MCTFCIILHANSFDLLFGNEPKFKRENGIRKMHTNYSGSQTKDGQILEAPRRILIECPHWASRSVLALRILHSWAKEPPWPSRGTPVAIALLLPLVELNVKKSISNYVEKVSY